MGQPVWNDGENAEIFYSSLFAPVMPNTDSSLSVYNSESSWSSVRESGDEDSDVVSVPKAANDSVSCELVGKLWPSFGISKAHFYLFDNLHCVNSTSHHFNKLEARVR